MRLKIKKIWLLLALLAGTAVVLTIILQRFFPSTPSYSTHNAGPWGTKAFYLLTRELGYNSQRLTNFGDPNGRPPAAHELLIVVDSVSLGHQVSSGTDLAEWVRQGGNLLLFTSGDSDITGSLEIEFKEAFFNGTAKVKKTPFTGRAKELAIESGRYISLKNKQAQVLAEGDEGPLAMSFPFGRGQVVVISDPFVITNAGIDKGDNVILLLSVLRATKAEKVWFDEFSGLALEGRPSGFQWTPTLITVGVQGALALLLLFIYWGKRFGRPILVPATDKGAAAQYVNTMANIFRQAKARDIALDNIYTAFWHRLTRAFGVSSNTDPAELISMCRQRPGLDTAGLERIVQLVKKVRYRGEVSETELFALVHDMEIWRRENLKNA